MKQKHEGRQKCANISDGHKKRLVVDPKRQQDSQSPDNLKAYERAVHRACIDAYVLLKDFPSSLRFSYFVGSDGKLLARCERRAG